MGREGKRGTDRKSCRIAARGGCENTLHLAHTRSRKTCAPRSRMLRRALESEGSLSAFRKHQDLRLLIRVARARARVTLDHSLGREEGLDLFARKSGALSGSWNGMRLAKSCLRHCETDPHAFRMLGTKRDGRRFGSSPESLAVRHISAKRGE
jgi:hypothetical protein